MQAWELFLGSDDCETCGTNFEEITLEWIFGANTWELTVRVGCYGGGQAQGDAAEIYDYATKNWGHLLKRHDREDLKQVLENAKK